MKKKKVITNSMGICFNEDESDNSWNEQIMGNVQYMGYMVMSLTDSNKKASYTGNLTLLQCYLGGYLFWSNHLLTK